MSDLLANLNPEQRRAVEYLGGPLLVVAGPGTGKTRVITHRIAYRVASGVQADRILGITFTNRAAAEMQGRVASLLGEDAPVRMGTFHWMCNALLRRYADRIGYPRDFRLLTPSEARHAFKRAALEAWPDERQALGRIAGAVSAQKNGASRELIARRYRVAQEAVDAVRVKYGETLRAARALDLDDLLALSVRLLCEDEATRDRCRAWYAEVVVDEFQDTNPIQLELLGLLVPPGGSIVAVGDEDQAIYGWRQADSRGMHRFLHDFAGARMVRLSESYRSSKRILRAAGSLIAHNPDRLGIGLHTSNPAGERPVLFAADDERDEAEFVAAEIERLTRRDGVRPPDVAVLYRVNAQSRSLEDALVRHRIPYHIHGGARFYERPEIRRVVAYLRLALGEDADAAALLAEEVSGIGPRRLAALRQSADASGISLLERLKVPVSGVPRISLAVLRAIPNRVETLRSLRDAPLLTLVSSAIDLAGESADVGLQSDAESVAENLDELRTVVRQLEGRQTTLRELVDRMSVAGHEVQRGGVNLMTLHAAKGLEFPVVFVTGVEDGLVPHRRSLDLPGDLDEERRLLYVGMTRARSRLFLSYAHSRMLAGRQLLGEGSRFIAEIGAPNLDLRVSTRRQARPRLSSVRVGERVVHPRWGTGTVMSVEGTGREALVVVEFDEAGRQRLQLCHAPLKRSPEEVPDVLAG